MLILKRKNYHGTIRKLCDDSHTKVYGIIGTIEELHDNGILEDGSGDETVKLLSLEMYAFVPAPGSDLPPIVNGSYEDIIERLIKHYHI